MSLYVPTSPTSQRNKLGLSLAGGGFRASLFHLGVLRRLAEMDVLRYVEVLSTVSGGSIVGALYILMLKEKLDKQPRLTRDEYVELVKSLADTFVAGVQKDLRTRLLMNPFGMFSVLVSHDSLRRRMGRIYQRYLFSKIVNTLGFRQKNVLYDLLWPGWIPLRKVRFNHPMSSGIEDYNKGALKEGNPGSTIPDFIMNATALNSGAPFRLSSNEIGDPRLGYFRYDEINILTAYKELLERSTDDLTAMMDDKLALPVVKARPPASKDTSLLARDAALARCWLTRRAPQPILPPQSKHWTLLSAPELCNVLWAMCLTNFGRLRQLKLPAWYLRIGLDEGITGGVDANQHLAHFNQVLSEVDPTIPAHVTHAITKRTDLGNELLDFAIALYYLRSAEVMSPGLRDDFESISLGTAVAASANFPPVFPPMVLLGIYDDLHITRLGLSDGGVYDNMGITTLVNEGCTHIIASDTGAPFDVKQRVSSRYIGMIGRLPDVLTDDVAEQQRTQLRERRRVSAALVHCGGANPGLQELKNEFGLRGLAFFSVDSLDPPAPPPAGIQLNCDPQAVASLRTDLDAFGDMEVSALINTGYDHADRFLKAYLTDSPYQSDYWNDPPPIAPRPPTDRDAYKSDIARILAVGQSRLFRSLKLWSIPSWLFVIAVLIVVLYDYGERNVSIPKFVNQIPGAILNRLENPFPLLIWLQSQHPFFAHFAFLNRWASELVNLSMPLWLMLGIVGVLAIAMFVIWPRITERFRKKGSPGRRKVVTIFKWARAFAPALFLIAGMTPVLVALVACALGLVSYFAFNKPYLWATRMR